MAAAGLLGLSITISAGGEVCSLPPKFSTMSDISLVQGLRLMLLQWQNYQERAIFHGDQSLHVYWAAYNFTKWTKVRSQRISQKCKDGNESHILVIEVRT